MRKPQAQREARACGSKFGSLAELTAKRRARKEKPRRYLLTYHQTPSFPIKIKFASTG
jgi:hypothetical protein